MVIAIDPRRQFDFIVEADRDLPADQQTVFRLRCLTAGEEAALNDRCSTVEVESDGRSGQQTRMGIRVHERQLALLHLGLVGWKNLRDADGNEIPFRTNGRDGAARKISDDCLSRLPSAVRDEIAAAIEARGTFTDDDASD